MRSYILQNCFLYYVLSIKSYCYTCCFMLLCSLLLVIWLLPYLVKDLWKINYLLTYLSSHSRYKLKIKTYMFVCSFDTNLPNYTPKTVSQILYWNLHTYTSGFLTSSVIVVIVDLQGKTGVQSSVRVSLALSQYCILVLETFFFKS